MSKRDIEAQAAALGLVKPAPKAKLLTLRVSEQEFEEIHQTAGQIGNTVTGYLLGLHRSFIGGKLNGKR